MARTAGISVRLMNAMNDIHHSDPDPFNQTSMFKYRCSNFILKKINKLIENKNLSVNKVSDQIWEVVVLESLDNNLHAGVGWLPGVEEEEEVEEAYEEEVVEEEEECGVEHPVAQLILLPFHLDSQLHFVCRLPQLVI